MGSILSAHKRNNSANEHEKRSTTQNVKHEASKQTTSESCEDRRNTSGEEDFKRQEHEVLEQVKGNRENKPRKTKEKERNDEVSYTKKTNENHATDSANDRKKIHEYEQKVKRLEADVIKLTQEKDQLLNRNDEVSYTTKTNENHATDSANDRKRIREYEQKVQRLEADVIKSTQEKDQLLKRLSEIGAIKLTENNHKVTDLSDENRPEKVAEQFSELYDIEWTDAYENLTKIQCKQADWSVKQLLDVLKAPTDFDLKETKKRIQEHRKKMSQENISSFGEEVRDRLKKKLEKEIYECLSDYIGKCVIICYNMCTKEPPMYLDFGDWKQAAQSGDEKPVNMPFDKLKFVTYTKSGDYIDYVVWPAVYICEGGPLMRKGVAQGSKLITNTMEDMENEDKCKMAKE